jgi:hypothetical protein
LDFDQLRGKLLEVIEVVFEYHEVAKLGSQPFAYVNVCKFGVSVKLRVVHRKIKRLSIVHDCNKLSSCQVRLIVLDDKEIPQLNLHVSHFESVAINCRWIIAFRQDPVNLLQVEIYVAFKASIALRKTIEEHWQIHRVKLLVVLHHISALIHNAEATLVSQALELDGERVTFLERPRGMLNRCG